jgi:hypothetical protein
MDGTRRPEDKEEKKRKLCDLVKIPKQLTRGISRLLPFEEGLFCLDPYCSFIAPGCQDQFVIVFEILPSGIIIIECVFTVPLAGGSY